MATLYNIKIKITSPWINYDEIDIEGKFLKYIKQEKFEGIEIKVERL